MKNRKVAITVAIPTFNRLHLLKDTLASVFEQRELPDEIVVVDDYSEKKTWKFLEKVSGIRLFRNKRNLGSFENINQAIRLAKSAYVIVLCSDDLILPNCIKVYKEKIARIGDGPAVFFSAGYHIDEKDRVLGLVQPFRQDKLFLPPKTVREFWDNYWFQLLIGGWSVWKKQLFKEVGFFTRRYGRAAENEMTLKILPHFPVYYINQPLFAYRIHSEAGIEGQRKNQKTKRGTGEAQDSIRVLIDYEKDPFISTAFTIKEFQERIFLRRPIIYHLIAGIFYVLTGKVTYGIKFFKLFAKFYPKPIFSLITLKTLTGWMVKLIDEFIKNIKVKKLQF